MVTCPVEEVGGPLKSSKSKRMDGRERLDSATLARLRDEGRYVFGDVKAHQRSHGGEIHVEGKAYIVDRTAIAKLIESIIGLRDALAQGIVHVLPCWPDAKLKLRADLRKAGVVPGNFTRQSLVRQFAEDRGSGAAVSDAGMFPIYLPHVTNLTIREIIDVRQAEVAAYELFQSALVNCVFTSAGDFSESKFEEYLKQIDSALRRIRAQMEQLQRRYNFKNRDILLKTLVLGVVALAPTGLSPALAPLFTSYSLFDYFSNRTELKTASIDAASGEFYVLWRLDEKSRGKKGDA